MKGLKFSALLSAIAIALPIASFSTTAIAQTTATDSTYLTQLYSFLRSEDATTYAMATQSMSEEDSVWAAQMFCRTFESGVSPTDAFLVYTNSAIEQATTLGANMTEEMAYAVGLYGGAVMNLGSEHYCPQYQPDVEQALASFQ